MGLSLAETQVRAGTTSSFQTPAQGKEETEAQLQGREDKVPIGSPLVSKDFHTLGKTKCQDHAWKEVLSIQEDSCHNPVKSTR